MLGAFITSYLPKWLEKLIFHAENRPKIFRTKVMALGFVLMTIGFFLQAADGVSFGTSETQQHGSASGQHNP